MQRLPTLPILLAICLFAAMRGVVVHAQDAPLTPVQTSRVAGGPDAFGYTFVDSAETNGPTFQFIDISTTGTSHSFSSQNSSATGVPLGFDFTFYDELFSEVTINANGYAKFGSGHSADSSNECSIPSTSGNENVVFAVHDDLDQFETTPNGDSWFESFAAGSCPYGGYGGACFVNQWRTYYDNTSPDDATEFELILFDNGEILVQVLDAGNRAGSSSTTGIEDATGTIASQYACNTSGSLSDNLAIQFTPPALQIDKQSPPFVAAGDVIPYTITIQSKSNQTLTAVALEDALHPQSNLIAGSLQVQNGSSAQVVSDTIEWQGDIAAGESVTLTYAVTTAANLNGILPNTAVVTQTTLPTAFTASADTQLVGAVIQAYVNQPAADFDAEACTTDTIAVPHSGIIRDLNVGFNASHNTRGNISATLTAPDGTSVVILDPPNDSDNHYDIELNDEGDSNLDDGSTDDVGVPVFERAVPPTNPLAGFDFLEVTGDWQLEVCSSSGTGRLNAWGLLFDSSESFLLQFDKTVTPEIVQPGDVVDYTIVIANRGIAPFVGGTLSDTIPADVTLVPNSLSSTVPTVSESGGVITWQGDIAAQETLTIAFSAETITSPPSTETSIPIINTAVLTQAQLTSPVTRTAGHQAFLADAIYHASPFEIVSTDCSQFPLEVTEPRFSADVRVGVTFASGVFRAQTEGFLISPDGQRVGLFSGLGFGENHLDVLFSDAASSPVDDGNDDDFTFPLFDRAVQPEESLSIFDQRNAIGTWQLEICAGNANNIRLLDWALFFDAPTGAVDPYVVKSAEHPTALTTDNAPTTYTLEIINPGGTTVNTTLTDALPAELNLIADTLSSSDGGAMTANDVVTWTGDIAAQSTITIQFQTLLSPTVANNALYANTATLAPANLFPDEGTTEHQAFNGTSRLYSAFGDSTQDLNDLPTSCFETSVFVPDGGNVGRVRVGLNMTVAARVLDLRLTAPTGDSISFHEDGTNFDNYDALFSDAGDLVTVGGNHDIGRPLYEHAIATDTLEPFANFNGIAAAGEWTLEICNIFLNDTFLHHWTLFLDLNSVTLAKTVSDIIAQPSDVLTYTIVLDNPSADLQSGLTISDPIPANTTFVNDSIVTDGAPAATFDGSAVTWAGDIAAGETLTISFNAKVDAIATARGLITNTATLNNSTSRSVVTEIFNDQDFLFTNSVPLDVPGNGCPTVVSSQIDVPNAFTVDSVRVGINAAFDQPRQMTLRLVAPDGTAVELNEENQTVSAPFDYLFDDDSAENFGLSDVAIPFYDRVTKPSGLLSAFVGKVAQGAWTLELCHDNIDSTSGTLFHWSLLFNANTTIELSLDKSADTEILTVGDTIHYTVTAQNSGGIAAQGVTISDTLPASLTLESVSSDTAPAPTFDGTTVQWTGDVPPNNTSVTLQFTATVESATLLITNTATLTHPVLTQPLSSQHVGQIIDGFDAVYTQETPTFYARCSFGFQSSTIVVPDSLVIQSLQVGVNASTRSQLHLALEAPNGLQIPLWIQPADAGGEFNARFVGGVGVASGITHPAGIPFYQPVEQPIGDLDEFIGLDAQGEWTLFFCDRNANSAELHNWSLLIDEGVTLRKSADYLAATNATLPYTIVATNPTDDALANVTIEDMIPNAVTLLPDTLTASKPPAPTFDGTTVAWTGDLAAGEQVTITFDVATESAETTFTNIATTTAAAPSASVQTQLEADYTTAFFFHTDRKAVCEGLALTRIPLEVSDPILIRDFAFGFNVIAADRDDIFATLTSPSGTVVRLMNRADPQPSPDAHFDILFRNSGSVGAHDGTNHDLAFPLYDQIQKPQESFGAFIGENALGTWTLTICDDRDQAYVDHVTLFVEGDRADIQKQAEPPAAAFNDTIDYTITVDNLFPTTLVGAVVTDVLSADLQLLANSLTANIGSVSFADGTITWTGDIPSGTSVLTISYRARVINQNDHDATLSNTATLAHPALPQPDSATAAIQLYNNQEALVSERVNAPLAIGCESPSRIALTVSDNFYVGFVEVGLNIATPPNLSADERGIIQASLIAPDGTFTALIERTFTDRNENFDVLLSDSADDSAHTDDDHDLAAPFYDIFALPDGDLTVFEGLTAQGDWTLEICGGVDVATLNHWTLLIGAGEPELYVGKSNSAFFAAQDDVVTYTIFVGNDRDTATDTVTLSDPLPDELTFVAGSLDQSPGTPAATFADGAIAWSGSIDASDEITITYQVTVTGDGFIQNTATISESALPIPAATTSTLFVPNVDHVYLDSEPTTIPDAGCTTRTITVRNHTFILNAEIGFVATHGRRGDLSAQLTTPDGTIIPLFAASADANANYDVLFSGNNAGALDDGDADDPAAPFFERFVLAEGLAFLGFTDAYGEWQLEVCDATAGDAGTLERWSLNLFGLTAEPEFVNGDFGDWNDGDGDDFCISDTDGADDVNGITDVTQFCLSTNRLDTLYAQFAFDEVDATGSAAFCALIDNDDNGNHDYALCSIVSGSSPTQLDSVQLFRCDDSSADSCTGQTFVRNYESAAFSNATAGVFDGQDSRVEVGVPMVDVIGAGVLMVQAAAFDSVGDLSISADLLTPDGIIYDTLTGSSQNNVPTAVALTHSTAETGRVVLYVVLLGLLFVMTLRWVIRE